MFAKLSKICYDIIERKREMEFSKRLKNLRTEKNISQEELAKLLNVSRTSVTNYELGRNEASAQVLNKLSEIFNCSIDYLLGKSDIRNPEKEINFDPDKLYLGLSAKDYKNITDTQMKQIEELVKVLLKDNLKKNNDEK